MRPVRAAAVVGGVAGPGAFVAAWVGAGLGTEGYSAVHDAISDLAAVGASTRPWMTAGMVAFGVGVPVFGLGLRRVLEGPAWVAAVLAGAASLGVAAVPLRPPAEVPAHAAWAAAAYVATSAIPLLAARPLARQRRRRAAAASVATGVIAAACLALSAAGPAHGLFQRTGLTVVDAWIVATSLTLLRREP